MTARIPLFLATFFLTAFLIHIFRRPAKEIGLLDSPGGRKQHSQDVPLVGGIAIFSAFFFTVLFVDAPLRDYSSLFTGIGLLLIAGILDDLHDISARSKLVVQILSAVLMTAWGSQQITALGNLFGSGELLLGTWSIPFTVLCVVGLINAVNMIDGMDGLAGGITVGAVFWLAFIAITTGSETDATLLLMLLAGSAGFLLFNIRHPWRRCAAVFLGDAGSIVLGFALAWFAVRLANNPAESAPPPITYAWIFALPVFDTVSLMTRRLLKGQSPFAADREHVHHIFVRAGYSQTTTVYVLIVLNFLLGLAGVLAWKFQVSAVISSIVLLVLFWFHLHFVMHAWRTMKLLKRIRRIRRQRTEKRGSEVL